MSWPLESTLYTWWVSREFLSYCLQHCNAGFYIFLVCLQYIFDNVPLFCGMPIFYRECPSVPVKHCGSHNSNMNILQTYVTRLYRVHASGCSSIHLEPVPVSVESLDPRFVFVLDIGLKIFMWYGKKSKNTLKSKARYNFLEVNCLLSFVCVCIKWTASVV